MSRFTFINNNFINKQYLKLKDYLRQNVIQSKCSGLKVMKYLLLKILFIKM